MYKKNNGVSKRLRLYPTNLTGNSVREKMETYVSIQTSLIVILMVGLFFIGLGYLHSKKVTNKNYIVGDRDENIFSLTASLTASALGAWILFGPASASTWGGIGAVIGYALGTAAPMLFLYNFGPKIRKEFHNGITLTEFFKKRFGAEIIKLRLFLSKSWNYPG